MAHAKSASSELSFGIMRALPVLEEVGGSVGIAVYGDDLI